MAIVKMKRLRLLALAADKDELLQRLLRAGCVEITEPDVELSDPEWAALVERERSMVGSAKSKVTNVSAALDTLKKYAPAKSGLFIVRKSVAEEKFCNPEQRAAILEKAAEINECNRQIGQLNSLQNRLSSNRTGLLPWSSLDVDLGLKQTAAARLLFGVCPAAISMDELQKKLSEEVPAAESFLASSDREQHYILIVCHKDDEARVTEVLRPFAFNPAPLKDVRGSAAENIASLDVQIAQTEEKRKQLGEKIASYAQYRDDLKLCYDQMIQELSKEEVRTRLVTTGTLVFLKGWVPEPDINKLEQELKDFTCALEYADPTDDDTPPTELRNSKLIHTMEVVTEMYSLPVYRGIDPNPLIFPFFTLFFGMMYADVAYGLVLIIVSRILIHKYNPKGTFGNLVQLATVLGVTTVFWGAISNTFFGDVISVFAKYFLGKPDFELFTPLINTLADPMRVLYLAIIMGVIQLITGMCIKIYLCFRDHHPLDALYDVGSWWLVFAGIAVLALKHSPYVLYAGIAALVLTQGRNSKTLLGKFFGGVASLYNITSWLGDVLSYTRLMALMLAGTVIASVFNILGTLPGNIVVFFVIFLFGQTFNMAVSIIGCFVHGARLQYLEYFTKFYQEGGIPFRPLRYNTKYVDIVTEGAEK